MKDGDISIIISMSLYLVATVLIGLFFAKRANKNSEEFFLGGRSIGPWVAAMSAEASDMSGWLLMGLPGVAYWCGLADAAWTAIGLAIGTYLNWLIVAKRLRNYSEIAGNAITIPDFLSNRFKETKKIILTVAAVFILIFFTVYAASCFVTCGKLFATLFDVPYVAVMIIGAVVILLYTLLGGFLAESVSDFVQAFIMIFALITIIIAGTAAAGGFGTVVENAKNIDGFFSFFGIAQPVVIDKIQQSAGGVPLFGVAGSYGLLTIISTMSWGLGYFGMPQVLLRFMGIKKASQLKRSRRIATVWVVISLTAAVFIGLIGRSMYPVHESLLTASGAESVFVILSKNLLPPLLAGIVMAGILAAAMSSSDSYLLIAASAFAKNIYQGLIHKKATDKQVMTMSRVVLLIITAVGIIIALDENSIIFKIVSFAWAGFGATFGPIILFSLFWKRTTRFGALAGMISGGAMVFIWNQLVKPMGGVLGIYELLPAFLVSCIFIVVVSLLDKAPSKEIVDEFEVAKAMSKSS